MQRPARGVWMRRRAGCLAPFAGLGQVPVQGSLALNLHAAMDGDTTTLAADGTVGITGGQPQASALVGDDGRLELAATLHGNDVTLTRLWFTGRAATLEAAGQVVANRVDLHWSLAVSDLAAAEQRLTGQLQATGTVTGTTDDLAATADVGGSVAAHGMSSGALTLHVEANGLPARPSGRITAQGDLLDAPVDLAVALRAGGTEPGDRHRARGLEEPARRRCAAGADRDDDPVGNLTVAMTRLADLAADGPGQSPAAFGPPWRPSRGRHFRRWMSGSTPRGCGSAGWAEHCMQPPAARRTRST
jgi:translocation and assembly module TamB